MANHAAILELVVKESWKQCWDLDTGWLPKMLIESEKKWLIDWLNIWATLSTSEVIFGQMRLKNKVVVTRIFSAATATEHKTDLSWCYPSI